MKTNIQTEALSLRRKGASYNQISKQLKVPKGTLSYWFKSLKESTEITKANIKSAKKIWAKNITAYNKSRSIKARDNWITIQQKARKNISALNRNDMLLVGTALYWAEGYKRGNWSVVFSNSDPQMHCVMMRYFLEICDIPLTKIKGQVQTHTNIDGQKAVAYWSKVTKIPKKQFIKCNVSLSKYSKQKRGNTLPYGTLRIRINDVNLTNKIKGLIQGLIKSANISGRSSVG